ncbi:xaa-Pro aminopeptidase ApepP-like isoform X2 [Daphnia carinata]|uniref:xaa-Pro aminopeptidase ApepP-like isoform X2 n=1 Tax=Daphnia carinata TaxID=120202 RepID=UPI0028684980|nr:xaa-Pro aminopeptidase ApepP-like isoform X2 [Daphnia carinata]
MEARAATSKPRFAITVIIAWLMAKSTLSASTLPTIKAIVYRNMMDRLACPPDHDHPEPANRVNTSLRVEMLRKAMALSNVNAYIITGEDQHQQTEMISPENDRRQFVSGFTGSSGTAVVTDKQAVLWTDGRYYLQADQQLDCQWILMKSGQDQVPEISHWLKSVLSPGDRVGADPKLVNANHWLQWRNELAGSDIWLDALPTNLVDAVWKHAKVVSPNNSACSSSSSNKPSTTAYVHDIAYSGQSWQDKVDAVRNELVAQKLDAVVLTALDEIAWLLNLRGGDVPYSPLVEGYVYLSLDRIVLFIQPTKMTELIWQHLNECQEGTICVEVRHYDNVLNDLPVLTENVDSVLLPSNYAYSGGVSFAIYQTACLLIQIPADKRRTSPSPLILLKAKKNAIEVEGMKNAHMKDAVALCDFLSLLEQQIREGKVQWDELKVVHTLDEYRQQQDLYRGPSFSTIAAFGPNGAVIHYRPSMETNRIIDNSSFLIIDSGGQYLDGTTDVTRTFHFGRATQRQKEIYTRVLMGAIDLATLVFPDSIADSRIDIIARQHLYQVGLDYLHGTGHGIGSFLNVHESPIQVNTNNKEAHHFHANYFFSDEPGYYLANEYGIRLETILRVVDVNMTQHPQEESHYGGNRFLGFEPVTLVPFEPNLILADVMTSKQMKWLNDYHQLVRLNVGAELQQRRNTASTSSTGGCWPWLVSKTRPVTSSP